MFIVDMSLLASFMNLAGPDLIVILLIVLVLFGAKKLPELARGMGQAVKEFQKARTNSTTNCTRLVSLNRKIAERDVRPAQSTVARGVEQAPGAVAPPQANEAVTPGEKANQV